jgi:hypothetical protein
VTVLWQETSVAPTATHHLCRGAPFYKARFAEVLSFHLPGIAAVRDESGAFHIRLDGTPLYPQRYRRTFGFYEGRAAVLDDEGAHHIDESGKALSDARFAWCGNFQGGRCAVRSFDGLYFHLTPAGEPAYAARWRYAGDFREGVAVVQAESGLHHHIDESGRTRGAGEWLDLDVFHKGFARARDKDGWFHLRRDGTPAYQRRFAAIEPFYNGQARCESFDGSLTVIDEDGQTIITLREPLRSPFASLSGDLVGFWRTQTAAAAVELRVPDCLPGSTESVARAAGLPSSSTLRLLRALGEMGIVEGAPEECWRLTAKGEPLRSDHPRSLGHAALEYAGVMSERWRHLAEGLKQGADWRPPDFFDQVADSPDLGAAHHRTLASYASQDYGPVAAAISLDGARRVVDAGGGRGVLLRLLLKREPTLRGILLDRPDVVCQRELPAEIDARIERRAASFFDPWGLDREGGCDRVVLARILHDWQDVDAVRILRRARESLAPGGLLYVAEMVMEEGSNAGALCDLHLLAVTGGRERTAQEYRALLARAGFRLRRIQALRSVVSLIEAEAA